MTASHRKNMRKLFSNTLFFTCRCLGPHVFLMCIWTKLCIRHVDTFTASHGKNVNIKHCFFANILDSCSAKPLSDTLAAPNPYLENTRWNSIIENTKTQSFSRAKYGRFTYHVIDWFQFFFVSRSWCVSSFFLLTSDIFFAKILDTLAAPNPWHSCSAKPLSRKHKVKFSNWKSKKGTLCVFYFSPDLRNIIIKNQKGKRW